jgi:hypothetical protein
MLRQHRPGQHRVRAIDVVPSPLAVAPASVTTRQSFHTWETGEPAPS